MKQQDNGLTPDESMDVLRVILVIVAILAWFIYGVFFDKPTHAEPIDGDPAFGDYYPGGL
jgi:hypothetical protein